MLTAKTASIMQREAVLSPDRSRRFCLIRTWDTLKPALMFIGLNPSTADELHDDPTVRRLVGFGRAWGMGRLVVCNLFTMVTPDPKDLPAEPPMADDLALKAQASEAGMILVGWGAHPKAHERGRNVVKMLIEGGHTLHCLGTNADGSPKHPLYIHSGRKPEPFGMVVG